VSDEHEPEPEGEETSGFLPPIPAELEIDPLLAAVLHCAAFLDLSEDDVIDPDAAVATLEHVGLYVGRLAEGRVAELQGQLDRLAAWGKEHDWPEEAVEFTARFLYNCGVGDDESDDDDAS
jgi:hypothetical protein